MEEETRLKNEMPLCFVRLRGQPTDKLVLGFKWRDYFQINSPARVMTVTFKEVRDPDAFVAPPVPGQKKSAFISILFILRRIE